MSGLVELLGETLLTGSGESNTAEALAGKGAVALYFSAHWCPPCRGFTPKLAEWYSANLKDKGLEVVFVSSDRDEDSFKEYFGEMPWLALPYADRDRKDALSKRFKVKGIPSVVILDEEGKVITQDGRAAISGDPVGDDFPWRPKSLAEILDGAKILGQSGEEVGAQALKDRVFAIYFSAHWCPPCRGFTPKLAEWYSKSLKDKGLEVLFVSSDKDQESFDGYFKEMPWLALDWADRKRKEQLSNLFGVQGIPSLAIIDKDGSTITKNGRAAVGGDPEGIDFPWYPKPVANLKGGPGDLNEVPTVVAFCETNEPAVQQAVEAAMAPVAQRFLDQQKSAGEDAPEIAFMIGTEAGDIGMQLRKIMSMPEIPAEAGSVVSLQPKLMIINIPDNGAFHEGPEGEITPDNVEKFVAAFKASTLERKQLQRMG